ncbi:hypothetical protein Leryth_020753 [Lithospermum erythrorhizon]|nr:hypothetical protein Leryth_020753 [Lithospermum erythrorhizon]
MGSGFRSFQYMIRSLERFARHASRSPGVIACVAWDDICTPKLEGGLGLMDIWKWNVALLTRAIWHFYRESDTIWVKFVKHFYLGSTSFWDYSPRDRDSFLFKRLCSIRDQLLSHFGGVEGTIAALIKSSGGR